MIDKNERKEKRKAKQRAIANQYKEGISGSEPEFGTDQHLWSESDRKTAIVGALNYYNSTWSIETRRKVLAEYIHDHGTKIHPLTLSIAWSQLKDWEVPQTLAAYCVMQTRGLEYTKKEKDYVTAEFQKLVDLSQSRKTEEQAKPAKMQKSIQDRVDDQTSVYIGAVEEMVDKFILSDCKTPPNLKDWFSEQSVKGVYAKRIAQFFTRNRDEINIALKKRDEQLVEGYANYGTTRLKALYAMYSGLVEDANAWGGVKAQSRKEPKRRVKSVDAQLRYIKYLPAYSDLDLTSIAPAKILGAGNLWTFNTKTRQLAWYKANDADGLKIKGTTLQNFDEQVSSLKKIRKPDAILHLIMGGQRPAEKSFAGIRAKTQKATGRINKYTILLRAHNIL